MEVLAADIGQLPTDSFLEPPRHLTVPRGCGMPVELMIVSGVVDQRVILQVEVPPLGPRGFEHTVHCANLFLIFGRTLREWVGRQRGFNHKINIINRRSGGS